MGINYVRKVINLFWNETEGSRKLEGTVSFIGTNFQHIDDDGVKKFDSTIEQRAERDWALAKWLISEFGGMSSE